MSDQPPPSNGKPIYGKAPYNPYDPSEARPIGGYPSEYAIPGKLTSSGAVRPATELQRVKNAMNQLHVTPRPASQLYPGQFKVLRRVNDNARFNKGSRYVATAALTGIVIYSLFFHRWNDGYDHLFSGFYRFQIKCKWFFKGTLSRQEFEDLTPKQKGINSALINESSADLSQNENKFALQRPSREHIIMAEKIAQEREERYLRAVDIAENRLRELNKSTDDLSHIHDSSFNDPQQTEPRKKWFGIF